MEKFLIEKTADENPVYLIGIDGMFLDREFSKNDLVGLQIAITRQLENDSNDQG